MSHAMMTPQVFAIRVLFINNIGCDDDDDDDDEKEEVDSDDDMEYTEDVIDNIIIEFSRD